MDEEGSIFFPSFSLPKLFINHNHISLLPYQPSPGLSLSPPTSKRRRWLAPPKIPTENSSSKRIRKMKIKLVNSSAPDFPEMIAD